MARYCDKYGPDKMSCFSQDVHINDRQAKLGFWCLLSVAFFMVSNVIKGDKTINRAAIKLKKQGFVDLFRFRSMSYKLKCTRLFKCSWSRKSSLHEIEGM